MSRMQFNINFSLAKPRQIMSKPFLVDDGNHHRQHIPGGNHERLVGLSEGQLDSDVVSAHLCRYP